MNTRASLLATTLACTAFVATAQTPAYQVLEVPMAQISDLNNLSQLVGTGGLWSGGVVVDLGAFELYGAVGINDLGIILGSSGTNSFRRGRCAGAGDVPALLAPDGGLDCSYNLSWAFPSDLNATSQVALTEASAAEPYIWDRSVPRFQSLPYFTSPLIDLSFSQLRAINDSGVIVGRVTDTSGTVYRAARWTTNPPMTVLDLGDLGGGQAAPSDINNAGTIIGTSTNATAAIRAFRWNDGAMVDIGDFSPRAINESEVIVGTQTGAGVPTAVFYQAGTLTDLNTLIDANAGWVLESATEINEIGQIAGVGRRNGTPRGFLLVPVAAPLVEANLISTIAPSQNPYLEGSLSYGGTITNQGPAPATDVVLTMTLQLTDLFRFPPYGLEPQPVLSKGSCLNATGEVDADHPEFVIKKLWCTIGTLAVGESVTVSYDTLGPQAKPSAPFAATVFSRQLDVDPGDNKAALTIPNSSNVNLTLTTVNLPSTVWVGQPVNYQLQLTNNGTTAADLPWGNADANLAPGASLISPVAVTYSTPGLRQSSLTYMPYQIERVPADNTLVVSINVIAVPDTDLDGALDNADNCRLAANGTLIRDAGNNVQRDTDGDGFGNVCDADLNQSGSVNAADLVLFRTAFGTAGPHADLNGDGTVNAADLVRFRQLFGQAPGPGVATGP